MSVTPPPAGGGRPGPASLSVVVLSGDFERVHYALVLASGALAIGTPVTLFFTLGATRALLAGPAGRPGWHDLAGDPVATDALHAERGIGRFEELLAACAALGARLILCEMGVRALGVEGAALRPDLAVDVAGVVTMLATVKPGGSIVTL